MRGHSCFAGLYASGSHIGVSYSFYFLDPILDAEIVKKPKQLVEHGDNFGAFFLHDVVEVANITKENCYVVLCLLHVGVALSYLIPDEFGNQNRKDILNCD